MENCFFNNDFCSELLFSSFSRAVDNFYRLGGGEGGGGGAGGIGACNKSELNVIVV